MFGNNEFLGAKQIQEWLGISKPTLLAWLRKKEDPLPGAKIGGRWKFRRSSVLEWWQKKENASGGDTRQPAAKTARAEVREIKPVPEELRSWLEVASRIISEDGKPRK